MILFIIYNSFLNDKDFHIFLILELVLFGVLTYLFDKLVEVKLTFCHVIDIAAVFSCFPSLDTLSSVFSSLVSFLLH